MPLVFAGVHLGAVADSAAAALLGVGAALAAAGALVGAIHGAFLLWLLPDAGLRDAAA